MQIQLNAMPLRDRLGRPRGMTAVLVDMTGRLRLERRLRHQAEHDSLTQLLNREALSARTDAALQADSRTGASTGLLMIDLDGFKEINDTLGHASGDQLLAQIGPRLLSDAVRANDVVARLSGDEFAVLLPDLHGRSNAITVAKRVLGALDRSFTLDSGQADIAASIGVAIAPEHAGNTAELLRCADVAMYDAKEQSAGIGVYRPAHDDPAPTRFRLLGELRQALERDELVVYYQPKVNLATRMLCGAEALVRWRHPTRGLLAPSEFIPVVETTGLIRRVTDYVLDAALTQASAWAARGHPIPVSVNLSARGLHDHKLPGRVLAALDQHHLPAGQLCLEITETAIMQDRDGAVAVLTELAQAGIGVSIDDFGTGYSSMSYLQKLPVSELKVDRSFIAGLDSSPTDMALIRSTIDLGHSLGLQVVAEGVENLVALAGLHQLGCDIAQGYYFARPMPSCEFNAWIAKQSSSRPTTDSAPNPQRRSA